MNCKVVLAGLLSMLALSSGCATTRGPKQLLSSTGHNVPASDGGVAAAFKQAADHAEQCRNSNVQAVPVESVDRQEPRETDGKDKSKRVAVNGSSCQEGATPAAKEMLRTGYALIYANCNDFFSSAGKTQKWLIFSRDVVGAVGTLATAVLALHEASDNAVANVGLATGAAFSGMDIYTRNFLFSAENVDSVRELILKALDVHRRNVEANAGETYESATLTLLDNQNICTPMSITALVREAIKKGDVVASNTQDDAHKRITDIQDAAVLRDLGRKLMPPGSLTMEQAGALYWLIVGSATDKQRTDFIVPQLADLKADTSPFKDGVYRTDWPLLEEVRSDLTNFSDDTQKHFRQVIAQKVAAAAEAAAAAETETGTETGTETKSLGPGAAKGGKAKSRASEITFDRADSTSHGEPVRRVSVGIR